MADRESKSELRGRLTGKGIYPAEYAAWLLNPLRYLILPPGRIVRRLQLKKTDHVLEVGCGPGYFSPSVARALPRGKLTLYDIQPAMLAIAEQRLKAQRIANYDIVEGNATSLPFPAVSFDVVFMVTVLGEIEDHAAAFGEFVRVLKPGGRLSITEQFGDPDYVPFNHLRTLADLAGAVFERRFGPRFFYTANFRKPVADSPQNRPIRGTLLG